MDSSSFLNIRCCMFGNETLLVFFSLFLSTYVLINTYTISSIFSHFFQSWFQDLCDCCPTLQKVISVRNFRKIGLRGYPIFLNFINYFLQCIYICVVPTELKNINITVNTNVSLLQCYNYLY